MITKSPAALAAFLLTLKSMQEPWEALFKKRYCDYCSEPCPFEEDDPEGSHLVCRYRRGKDDSVLWWLEQETERTVNARETMLDLNICAIKREFGAQDEKLTALLRTAADTISDLLRELER